MPSIPAQLEEAARKEREAFEALPTFEELCVSWPLYTELRTTHRRYLSQLRRMEFQFDAHCVGCNDRSTFKFGGSRGGGAGLKSDDDWMLKAGMFDIVMSCQRKGHQYVFSFYYDGAELLKFGQLPSLEDIVGADIAKFRPLLRDGYFAELRRATGLASHGIGIGAFVYLRRIFEKLIHDHHRMLSDDGKAVEKFDRLRMDEKIDALKDVLPPALVRHKAAYGILSVGLHELDEDSCRKHFPVVRAAIIEILEQDLQARERERASAALEAEIAKISENLKGRNTESQPEK